MSNASKKLLSKAESERRQYGPLLIAIQTITEVLHIEGSFTNFAGTSKENLRDEAALCNSSSLVESERKLQGTTYFLRHHGLITLASKFKELSPIMIEPTFNLFQTLIEDVCAVNQNIACDQDLMLGITAFLQSMMNFNIIDRNSESKFCELMLSMASIMKIYDGLLVSWFRTIEEVAGAPSRIPSAQTVGKNRSESIDSRVMKNDYHREFPLFCLLLNYVHHGGKAGEYSRTGLLYLIEVASESEALVKWVLISDLGSLMASGLCALYSQLIRARQQPGVIDELSHLQSIEKKDLDTFLSYLLFWQDMLAFARKSSSLTKNLVYHFDVLFVRQLLYPLIFENTDSNGGYSDLLIELFTSILDTLDHNLLSQAILCYFMGFPLSHESYNSSTNIRLPSISIFNSKEGAPILTLHDIISSTLIASDTSKRERVLRLLSLLVSKYYPYTVNTLIPIQLVPGKEQRMGYLQDLNIVQTVCRSILSGVLDFELSQKKIENYKKDIEIRAERTLFPAPALKKRFLAEEIEKVEGTETLLKANYPRGTLQLHQLQEKDWEKCGPEESPGEDCILSLILGSRLPSFFLNSSSENLMLTLFLVELGTSGWLDLHGWATKALLKQILQLKNEYSELRSRINHFSLLLVVLERSLGLEEAGEMANLPESQLPETLVNENEASWSSNYIGGWASSPLHAKQLMTRSFSIFSLSAVRSLVFTSEDESNVDDPSNDSESEESSKHGEVVKENTLEQNSLATSDNNDSEMKLPKNFTGTTDMNEIQDYAKIRAQLEEEINFKGEMKIKVMQLCTNALIFQDFVCELEALYHVRFWLYEN